RRSSLQKDITDDHQAQREPVRGGAMTARTAGGLRSWLSVRHSLRSEAAAVLVLYGLYELARGLVVGDTAEADGPAHQLIAIERSLHLFLEANVQQAAHAV